MTDKEKAAYRQYEDILHQVSADCGLIPHCDSNLLHRPEICKYCASDKYEELHTARELLGINYTGEYKPDLFICPAEQKRNLPTIEKWGGNRVTGYDYEL